MSTSYIIDAQGKAPGRVATEAATALRGKLSPSFERHTAPGIEVKIVNASKVVIHPKRIHDRHHRHYSGYPSGLKQEPLKDVIRRKGHAEILRKAVQGMLPGNKLRPILMKHLIISE